MSQSNSAHIIASYSEINGKTSQQKNALNSTIELLTSVGITPITLTIDPLSTPWFSPQQHNHFRSGCAPILALEHATTLIQQGEQAVIIQANEPLKTGYNREERHQLMAIYDEEVTIADLYNDLANSFIKQHHLSHESFKKLAINLFENYQQTYQSHIDAGTAHFSQPASQWYEHVTPLFRGVDCANPLIDFSGQLLIGSSDLIKRLALNDTIKIAGVNCRELSTSDERQDIEKIAEYSHLRDAYLTACQQSGIRFNEEFLKGNALLEAYTCYPIVPMALLLAADLVDKVTDIPTFLETQSITVTGGMNLARAPWNAPSLNALISISQQLQHSNKQYGLVHGNGGLGYRQGIAILEKD